MQFRFDQDANSLYIALHEGQFAQTIEITDMVYVDIDASGTPLGVEFVGADEFVPFLRRLQELDAAEAWPVDLPTEIQHLFSVRAA